MIELYVTERHGNDLCDYDVKWCRLPVLVYFETGQISICNDRKTLRNLVNQKTVWQVAGFAEIPKAGRADPFWENYHSNGAPKATREELAAAGFDPEWIPVSEALPDDADLPVLAYSMDCSGAMTVDKQYFLGAKRDNSTWCFLGEAVLCWCPIPKPERIWKDSSTMYKSKDRALTGSIIHVASCKEWREGNG